MHLVARSENRTKSYHFTTTYAELSQIRCLVSYNTDDIDTGVTFSFNASLFFV
jgi:hypothetical protein